MASTLVVEDGTGVENATSYVSLTNADAYHTKYDNTSWSGSDSDKDVALTIASRAIDLLYGDKYLSTRKQNTSQAFLFPRYAFYDKHYKLVSSDEIPQCLQDAVCELALKYLEGGEVYPVVNVNQYIKQQSVSVGELSVSTTYGQMAPAESFSEFRKIDLLLFPILKGQNSGNWQMYR
jgi:hypothetical protein